MSQSGTVSLPEKKPKIGRPRKYQTKEEEREGAARRMREYRARMSVEQRQRELEYGRERSKRLYRENKKLREMFLRGELQHVETQSN